MPEQANVSQETYLYRRVSPTHYSSTKNEVSLEAFALGTAVRGLSVYCANLITPRRALQMIIDEKQKQAALAFDEQERAKVTEWLVKNPTVEALVQKGWRIVRVPISEVVAMGFALRVPDVNGHLNILGMRSQFDDHKADFTELIKLGKATLLTDVECLWEA